jgi:hypothetical protein
LATSPARTASSKGDDTDISAAFSAVATREENRNSGVRTARETDARHVKQDAGFMAWRRRQTLRGESDQPIRLFAVGRSRINANGITTKHPNHTKKNPLPKL